MIQTFKPEIKTLLIVVLVAAVISVIVIFLLRGLSPASTPSPQRQVQVIDTTDEMPSKIDQDIIDYLDRNITELVKAKPVLGAEKFFITKIEFYSHSKILAEFEDGHINGYFLGQYTLENNTVRINYIDEIIGSIAERNVLVKKYDISSERMYARPQEAGRPWVAELIDIASSCTSVYTPAALRQDLDVIDYLDRNINGMVKAKPLPGVDRFSLSLVRFFSDNKVFAEARSYSGDSFKHVYFVGEYAWENNKVRIDYIDEAMGGMVYSKFGQRELLEKYGLMPGYGDAVTDRWYEWPRKANCPWILHEFNTLPPGVSPSEITNPAASITIRTIDKFDSATSREFVYLDLTCSDPGGIKDMRYTDEESFTTEAFEPFKYAVTWDLQKEGVNTITYQCRDNDGNITTVSDSIVRDTTGPTLSDGKPTGAEVLPAGTISAVISLKTDEPATCRYAPLPDFYSESKYYGKTAKTFSTTGATFHQATVTELPVDQIISYFVACYDVVGNDSGSRFEISFVVEPSFPQPYTGETTVSISQSGTWATIKSSAGKRFVHVDQIKNLLTKELYPYYGPYTQLSFSENQKISPDKNTVAFGIGDSNDFGAFTVLYRFSTKSLSYLGLGSPALWSPNSKYLLTHVRGFELEDMEIIYDIETGRIISTIDNNLNLKKILRWGSENTVEYTTEEEANAVEILWSLNVESGAITKVSETSYPLSVPQILQAYMHEDIGLSGFFGKTVVIVWTTERPSRGRVYWALDKEGPWNKISGSGDSFVVPDVPPGQEKIFYRVVAFANDGRESEPSVIVEGKPACCWSVSE